ncbi:flocculation protein FLO11-like isoform X4 [Anopheles merus]|uniref:flocculation protein FLO11-like isoform X4 n=1 Tax=Anopheles merus TaxID=30066 RepID=UPI001BE3EC1E|nr:flocculation protein FLO11-like isoform X4 [Anopheles merus]
MCDPRSCFRKFLFLSIAMLLLHICSAQQYTGVKSVLSPAEANKQSAHSARSVDGGVPSADSNIINLAITPFARGQGFSAAKGRNLGFVNDASLNAIPAGINNELTNVDARGSTLQPNTVLRDSYGNPVTPFTDLAKPELDSVGFQTNVNRDSNLQPSSSQVAKVGQYNFKVPSYASGIIEPVAQPNYGLLPPNPVSSTVQAVPSSGTKSAGALNTQQQFLPNAKIPNIEEGKILFAQKPVNGLLPPLFPDQLPPVYDVKVGTERSPIFARDPFDGSLTPSSLQPTRKPNTPIASDNAVGFKTDVNQQTNFPQQGLPTGIRLSGSTTTVSSIFPTVSTGKPVVQKYNGGFGGPAGFLGNQQNIGTAYTSTVRPILSQPVPSAPQPQPPRPQPVFTTQNSFPTTARPDMKSTIQKYMGSFGGAPGFLGNQANIGTAYTKDPQTFPVSSTVAPVQQFPPVQHVGSTHPASTPVNSVPGRPQAPIVPPTPNPFNVPVNANPASPGSGVRPMVPSTFMANQQPVKPVPVTNSFNGGNKFTGSFGGAPGILGNQQRPGTNVNPDGTVFSPVQSQTGQKHQHQQQPLNQQFQQSKPIPDTFTGSFGGPPGVLRPFDNTKG